MKTFKFSPHDWFANRALRLCSPGARGLWVDLLCLMHPTGYLVLDGKPLDDSQIGKMVGEPIAKIKTWLQELGEAGIYSVTDDGKLYSARMAGVAAHKANIQTKRKQPPKNASIKSIEEEYQEVINKSISVIEKPQRKSAAWYDTPAGWARKGAEQAISIGASEDIASFQIRVSARIPPGPHLEVLTESQRKAVEAATPKA